MRFLSKFFLLLFLSFVMITLEGQNLVPNSSFNEYLSPPTRDGNFSAIKYWKSASGTDATDYQYGTPDFFHREGVGKAQIPNTGMGVILPKKDMGVAGIVTYNSKVKDFREYIYVALRSKLTIGKKYKVSFFISNGFKDQYGGLQTNGIGILFSHFPPKQYTNEVLPENPQLMLEYPVCTNDWIEFSFNFIADQDYHFITIGNFLNDDTVLLQSCDIMADEQYAYYLLDDIRIVAEGSEIPLPVEDPEPVAFPPFEEDDHSSPENSIVAKDDQYALTNDKATFLEVLLNDKFEPEQAIRICDYTYPDKGVVVKFNNKFKYVPNKGKPGMDEFTYTICSESGQESTARVRIDFAFEPSPKNPPVAKDDRVVCQADAVEICVLDNDFDPDGTDIELIGNSNANHGKVIKEEDCLKYFPYEGFSGIDAFEYTIKDADGLTSKANVLIEVLEDDSTPNLGPQAVDDYYNAIEVQTVKVCPLYNDTDPENDPLTIAEMGEPKHGKLTAFGDCFEYRITTKESARESIMYLISDGNGNIAEAEIIINIKVPRNAPPIGVADTAISNGNAIQICALSNDYDPEGQELKLRNYAKPMHGSLLQKNGCFIYTPDSGFEGTDRFRYQIEDETGLVDEAAVVIRVIRPAAETPKFDAEADEVFTPDALDGFAYNHLTFLVDVSRSMNKDSRLPLLKNSLIRFMQSLRKEDKISIVEFSGNAQVVIANVSGNDRAGLEKAINSLSIRSKTNIVRGMDLSYNTARKNYIPDGNNRIIVSTDGKFSKFEALTRIVKENMSTGKDISLSIFCFAEEVTAETEKQLSKLAELGNGNFYILNADNAKKIILQEAKKKSK